MTARERQGSLLSNSARPRGVSQLSFDEESRAVMAGRILNRRALREQADQVAQQSEGIVSEAALVAAPATKGRKAKAPAAPKVKKVRAKKAPPRMRARWGVFDPGMKQVAIFDYNQRAAADEKVSDLNARKKAGHFLQIVKEAMPEPPPVEVAESTT